MGGEQQPLTIGITLEHEDGVVRAQRWVKGVATLQIHDKDVHLQTGNQGNFVKVEFIGQEITHTVSRGTKTEDIFHEESSKRILASVLEAKCQYSFPFSIYLPGTIAPSMKYEDPQIHGAFCRIKYRLTASFLTHTLERKIHVVGQPLSSKFHPVTVEPSVVPVVTKTFSWKNMESKGHRSRGVTPGLSCHQEEHRHGCLIWAAKVKNSHIGKGEEVSFSFSLRNDSSYDVIKLNAKLIEKISWKTETETRSRATELGYILMPNSAFLNHQKATISRHQSQVVPIEHQLAEEMSHDLDEKENTVTIHVPSKCRDTYRGKLIQITHHLVIEARTARQGDEDHNAVIKMELPLKVFDPPLTHEGHVRHHSEIEFHSPAEVAEKVMTRWPGDAEEEMQASFTSIDDTSWDASDNAVYFPQIREES